MPVTTTTPLMNLVLPVVGPTGQIGPTWATNNNEAFTLIDSHDHTSGKGSRVPTAGISINADLSMGGYNLTNTNTTKYNSLGSALSSSFTNSVYVVGGELYFNDAAGTDVQLTSGGAINVASLGTITGDYSTSTADLNYSDITKTFTFKQSATATAFISCGSISIFENVAGAKFTTLQNTTSQASDQVITLPASFPGSTKVLSLSASGVLATGVSNTVVTADITDSNITTAKIADQNITQAKLAARATGTTVAAGGVAISATINYNITSSQADVTNSSVTITTTGRPVFCMLQANDNNGSYSIYATSSSTGSSSIIVGIRVFRDATEIYEQFHEFKVSGPTTSNEYGGRLPLGALCIDTPAAGTYTYKLQAGYGSSLTSAENCDINEHKFVVFEL